MNNTIEKQSSESVISRTQIDVLNDEPVLLGGCGADAIVKALSKAGYVIVSKEGVMKAEKRVEEAMARLFGKDDRNWPPGVANTFYKVVNVVEQEATERAAHIAEHLNGWGSPPAPLLANHIAAVIRNSPPQSKD